MSTITTVQEFLDLVAGARSGRDRPRGWDHGCAEDFVRAHGRAYEIGPEWLGAGHPRGRPGACFRNTRALVARHPGLVYVEGFAAGVIPVLHAWAATPDGQVVDVTWRDTWALDYFGVPFARAYALAPRPGSSSLIDAWSEGWPLWNGSVPFARWAHETARGNPGPEEQ